MENPKELIKSGENDLENISFSYFSIKNAPNIIIRGGVREWLVCVVKFTPMIPMTIGE